MMLMLSSRTAGFFKRLVLFGFILCVFVTMMKIIGRKLEKERLKQAHREALASITCTDIDYTDSPFITKLKKSDVIRLPDKQTIYGLSREELSFLYHRYVESLQYLCTKVARIGSIADGGWDVCEEKVFRPMSPCLVYSFGINNDFSFDDHTIERYGCEVHSFDPSMQMKDFQRSELNFFYNIGLGTNDSLTPNGWRLMRLESIKNLLGHNGVPINILKIDIETMEWDVLTELFSHNALKDVDNLLVEFHMNVKWPPTEEGRRSYLRNVLLFKDIYDAGFRIFWTHRNTAGSLVFHSKCKREERANCHELSFVRLRTQGAH